MTHYPSLTFFFLAVAACGQGEDATATSATEEEPIAEPVPSELKQANSGPEKIPKRYDQGVFAATHNSYSGEERGTIVAQLDAGVRFIELDVWDDRYGTDADLHVGHDAIGHEVALGNDNPDDTKLQSWLQAIWNWSDAHPTHGPIVVSLDLKSDMTSASSGGADPDAIDKLLQDAFGAKLFAPDQAKPSWPSIESMRGKLLVMLSGHEPSRKAYRSRKTRTAFVDFQLSDSFDKPENFIGVRTGQAADLQSWSGPGRLTRVWRFGDEASDYGFRVHFPATDRPFSPEYKSYCEKQQCVQ